MPLIAWQLVLNRRRALHHGGHGGQGGKNPESFPALASILAFIAGALVWAIPLVVLSGGVGRYWHALVDQGAEDFGNIQMLWTRHGARDVADALYYAFVAPWAQWWIAALVLVSAAIGFAHLWRHRRHTI